MGATYAKLRLWTKAQAALSKFLQLRPEALHERFQLGMTFFDWARARKTDPGLHLKVTHQFG